MKRAAIYCRVSTEEQARHGYSIGAQLDNLRAYAKEHGYRVIGEYVDEGISARKPYKKRPALLRLLEVVEADGVDVILFVKLDRWFRNVAAYYQVQPILDAHNVAWQATLEDYETITSAGRFKVNIMLSVAEDEADRTSERIKFVLDAKKAKGEHLGGNAMIGFKREGKFVVPDPEQSELIHNIYREYIDTRSVAAVRNMLIRDYDIARNVQSLRRTLRNKCYIEIVGRETFQRAQELLSTRSQRNSTSPKRVYLFTSLLYCRDCGGRYKSHASKGIPYYSCYKHNVYGPSVCPNEKHIPESRLEKFLLDNIENAIRDYNVTIVSRQKPKRDNERIRRKMEKLKDLYLDDLITREVYERDYRALENELNVYEPLETPIDIDAVSDAIKLYGELSRESKKAFWSRTVRRIESDKNGQYFFTV